MTLDQHILREVTYSGKKQKNTDARSIIARFRIEAERDEVFRRRTDLKVHNHHTKDSIASQVIRSLITHRRSNTDLH